MVPREGSEPQIGGYRERSTPGAVGQSIQTGGSNGSVGVPAVCPIVSCTFTVTAILTQGCNCLFSYMSPT